MFLRIPHEKKYIDGYNYKNWWTTIIEKDEEIEEAKYGEDRFVEVNSYSMHYVEVGEGEPMFMIPGSFAIYRSWNKIIPYLSDDFRLLTVDYIGVGYSDKPKSGFHYTVHEQSDMLAKIIKKLALDPGFHSTFTLRLIELKIAIRIFNWFYQSNIHFVHIVDA